MKVPLSGEAYAAMVEDEEDWSPIVVFVDTPAPHSGSHKGMLSASRKR